MIHNTMNYSKIAIILLLNLVNLHGMEVTKEDPIVPRQLNPHLTEHFKYMLEHRGTKLQGLRLPLDCQMGECLEEELKKAPDGVTQSVVKELLVDLYNWRITNLLENKPDGWEGMCEQLFKKAGSYGTSIIDKRNRALYDLSVPKRIAQGVRNLNHYLSEVTNTNTEEHKKAMHECMNLLSTWIVQNPHSTPEALGATHHALGKLYDSCGKGKETLATQAYEAAARHGNRNAMLEVGLRIFATDDFLTNGISEAYGYLKQVCDFNVDNPKPDILQKKALAHCIVGLINTVAFGSGHADLLHAYTTAPNPDALFRDCARYMSLPFAKKIVEYIDNFLKNSEAQGSRAALEEIYFLARVLLLMKKERELQEKGKQAMQVVVRQSLEWAMNYIALDEHNLFSVDQRVDQCLKLINPSRKTDISAEQLQYRKIIVTHTRENNLTALGCQAELAVLDDVEQDVLEKIFNRYEKVAKEMTSSDHERDAHTIFNLSERCIAKIRSLNNLGALLFVVRYYSAYADVTEGTEQKELYDAVKTLAGWCGKQAKKICQDKKIDSKQFVVLQNKYCTHTADAKKSKPPKLDAIKKNQSQVPAHQPKQPDDHDIKAKLAHLVGFLNSHLTVDYASAVADAQAISLWKASFHNNIPRIDLLHSYEKKLKNTQNLRAQYLLHFLSDQQQDSQQLANKLWLAALDDFDKNGSFNYDDLEAACELGDPREFYTLLDERMIAKLDKYLPQCQTADRAALGCWLGRVLACSSDPTISNKGYDSLLRASYAFDRAHEYIAFLEPNASISYQEICASCLRLVNGSSDTKLVACARKVFDSYLEQGFLFAQFRVLFDEMCQRQPNILAQLNRLSMVPSKQARLQYKEEHGVLTSLLFNKLLYATVIKAADENNSIAQNFLVRAQLTVADRVWNIDDFAGKFLSNIVASLPLTAENREYMSFLCYHYAKYLQIRSLPFHSWLSKAQNLGHAEAQLAYALELLYGKISLDDLKTYENDKTITSVEHYGIKLLEKIMKEQVLQGDKNIAQKAFKLLRMFTTIKKSEDYQIRLKQMAETFEIPYDEGPQEADDVNVWQLFQTLEKVSLSKQEE